MAFIEIESLKKEFKVIEKKKGIRGSISSIIKPIRKKVCAVDDVSFSINKGDIVGYLGPNGAGKSTTVKMMTGGILHPSSGTVRINGLSPHDNRKEVVKNIGVVFGQRTQLYWDLRLGESFELLKRIYQIKDEDYKRNIELMDKVLGIKAFIDTPVRQLSLGQRMRGDLAAAMLHSPSVLFLDEPTIGLDVEGKYAIREFIKEINKRKQTTVILTTHDLDDVEQLCNRLIVINKGKVIEDGPPLKAIMDRMAPFRYLVAEFEEIVEVDHHPNASVHKQEGSRVWFRFNKASITATKLISDLTKIYPIKDISVEEPDIEDIIREVYNNSPKIFNKPLTAE